MLKTASVAQPESTQAEQGPLLAYSRGLLSREHAIRQTGLRDYAELLVALGDAGLSLPLPPEDEIDRQAADFVKLWKMG